MALALAPPLFLVEAVSEASAALAGTGMPAAARRAPRSGVCGVFWQRRILAEMGTGREVAVALIRALVESRREVGVVQGSARGGEQVARSAATDVNFA